MLVPGHCSSVKMELDTEVFKDRLIGIGLFIQRHANLIDDLVAATLLDR